MLKSPAGLLFLLVACTACSTLAPPAPETSTWSDHRSRLQELDSWQLRGRVNVRYHNESHTPRIRWQQQQAGYRIRLWGTFNTGNTLISGRPGSVTLEQDGQVLTANSPEQLILQELGYELPVSHLEYWIKGLPAPLSRAELTFNESGRLQQMQQDGWTVLYQDPRQYGAVTLPRRVEVSRAQADVRLRFVGLSWTLPEAN